jgi:hypothetical protein
MTPAERQYDLDLVKSMRTMARQIERRSKKIATTLRMAADRIDALSREAPIITPPASTPDQGQPEPVEHGIDNRRGEADPRG